MEKNKITELLQYRFSLVPEYPKKRHIIFWYDPDEAFKEIVENLKLDNIKIIILKKEKNRKDELIDTNIFLTKYTLECVDTTSNYLIYSNYPRPEDKENFLVDIEKYSEFFQADKSAIIIEELNLDRTNFSIINCIKEHLDFFNNKERKEKIKKLYQNTQTITDKDLKLGILAVTTNSKTINIEEILKNIIIAKDKLDIVKKWISLDFLYNEIKNKFDIEVNNFDTFLRILLVVYFYKELQIKPHRNLEKYYQGKTNDIYIFVSSMLQNNQISPIIKNIFNNLAEELNLSERIKELDLDTLILGTSLEIFDKIIIKYIAKELNIGTSLYEKYEKLIYIRLDNTLWKEKYGDYYKFLLSITNIFKIKDIITIKNRETLIEIFNDYTSTYYKFDTLYRDCFYFYDAIKNIETFDILDELKDKISYFYEKEYLEKLLPIWSEFLSFDTSIQKQSNFYKDYICTTDTRTVVIISDALRYEIGYEIFKKLQKEATAREIIIKGMITDLPSITPVGMTNLLPNINRIINPLNDEYSINNINTNSTDNRDKILKIKCLDSNAILYKNFKNLNRNEQEDFIKGKKTIYIYHDIIDSNGDSSKTEHQTFNACNIAINDIVSLSKTLSSLGIVNIYITSDHGFLYERKEIEEYNKLELNKQHDYKKIGKRYALSESFIEEKGCITLKLENYYGIFPKKNQRIKVAGNGLQFVHGGISPQEMIVPLIQYKSGANSKKSSKVKVRIKESGGKITSNLTKFTLYQLDAVNLANKIIPRDISASLYDGDIRVSNEIKIRLNASEENYQHDFRLTLSGEHEKVILKIIDIETGDIIDSKEYIVKIGIISQFDF